MKTLKTVVWVGVLAVVVIGALALVMAGRGWWNAGTETATPTTVTVTAEPDTETETETEEPETRKTEDTEAEVTETKEPEDTADLALKRDKKTVADLSGQEKTAVRSVLRDCMDQVGAIHYVSQVKACLADNMDGWSEDSARRSGETAY